MTRKLPKIKIIKKTPSQTILDRISRAVIVVGSCIKANKTAITPLQCVLAPSQTIAERKNEVFQTAFPSRFRHLFPFLSCPGLEAIGCSVYNTEEDGEGYRGTSAGPSSKVQTDED